MTYRKSDGPFGMLPKKTAMDLESSSGLYAVLPRDDAEPKSHRAPKLDLPAPRPAGGPSGRDQGRSSP